MYFTEDMAWLAGIIIYECICIIVLTEILDWDGLEEGLEEEPAAEAVAQDPLVDNFQEGLPELVVDFSDIFYCLFFFIFCR